MNGVLNIYKVYKKAFDVQLSGELRVKIDNPVQIKAAA